jgi:hypothetical protein
MTSQYIPKQKQVVKEPLLTRIGYFFNRSVYIGKLKISLDTNVGGHLRFGFSIYPNYKMFEFNFGRAVLNFWYRG